MKGKPGKGRLRKRTRRSPAWAVVAGVVLVGTAVALAYGAWRRPSRPPAALEVTGAPALRASPERIDLGDVRLGQTVQVAVELANVGDQTLRLSQEPWIEVVEGC